MIDLVKLQLVAGDGGNGKISYRREKYVPKGGPDGGYGGNGGDVIFVGDKGIATLKHLSGVTEIAAKDGQIGGKRKRHGAEADPVKVRVPLGTTLWVIAENDIAKRRRESLNLSRPYNKSEIRFDIYEVEKEGMSIPEREQNEINNIYDDTATDLTARLQNLNLNKLNKHKLVEITEHGQEVIVCQGGFGGRGNIAFKSSRNTTPLEAEYGTRGEKRIVLVELKLLAHVGLVGFPNAGKSTLVSKVTKANPKIGAYPFTTIEPNLGLLSTSSGRELVIADIPGLIEGASEGKGLGYSFLRHVESCQVILYVLSLDESIVFDELRTVQQKAEKLVLEWDTLKKELSEFRQEILDKPFMLSVNKADLYSQELKEAIKEAFAQHDQEVIIFSGITGENLNILSSKIESFID